jgi:uncharacterized protein (TIGR03435 family)
MKPTGLALFVIAAGTAFAADAPSFESASVKPAVNGTTREGRPQGSIKATPGYVVVSNSTLSECIQWAYSLSSYQVSGPSWIDSERYDISARAASPAPEAQLRLMLRPLLSERFRLEFHRETKTLPGYALLVAQGGPKLRESTAGGEPDMKMNRSIVVAQAMPMEHFVTLLMRSGRGPVVDLTGLVGRYDFTFDLAKYVTPDTPPDDMFTALCQALQQELGLRVEARKLTLEVLVLDHAEKAPLEN